MDNLIKFNRSVIFVIALLGSSLAQAAMHVPAKIENEAQKKAHEDYVHKELPWIEGELSEHANLENIPQIFTNEATLLPKLFALKEFGELATEKPELKTLTLEFVEQTVVTDTYFIREAPPTLGIWRGYLGGDCSSRDTFAFPYSPLERGYYVYNSKGVAKGYIMATVVMVDGKRTLYMHDVTGRHLSPRLAEKILHGFYQALSKLDSNLHQITIPKFEQIHENNNFVELVKVQQKYANGRPLVKQTYLDTAIRSILSATPGSSTKYDSPEVNSEAVVFEPNPEILSSIRTRVEDQVSYGFEPNDVIVGASDCKNALERK